MTNTSTYRPDGIEPAAIAAVVRDLLGPDASTERTADGISSVVYRVRHRELTYYLRVAEAAGEDLETDATLFRHLRELGVRSRTATSTRHTSSASEPPTPG